MSALGDTFRIARESQGLTLSDVAERIHIRSVFLAAIESEDWNAIGQPVYIRGFMRTYARCLGLDADAAVARFADIAAGRTPSAPTVTPAGAGLAPAIRPNAGLSPAAVVRSNGSVPSPAGRSGDNSPKRGLSLGAMTGVLIAFALVLFVGYQFVDYRRGGSSVVNRAHSAATAQPERVARELQRPAADLRSTLKPDERSSGFALRLQDSSWLRVVVDGKVLMEGLYPKGTTRTFSGRSATVRVGNAGGVDIAVDGKDLGPMGGLGDVAERSFQL